MAKRSSAPSRGRNAPVSDPNIKDFAAFDPRRPLAQELNTNVADGFSLCVVGDCILSRPLSHYESVEPAFAKILAVLRASDATCGNLETTILDLASFQGHPYAWDGDWPLSSLPAVTQDFAKMGFNLLARANNHTLDWGLEGMRETSRRLDEAGLIHAGSGETQGLARAPRYFESPKGRVALVSMVSTFRPTSDALAPRHAAPGRPGVSALRLKHINVVPREVMAKLREVAKAVLSPAQLEAATKSSRLSLFGKEFEIGERTGYRHEMDPDDLAGILYNIRQGKQSADVLIATIHAHEIAAEGFPELPSYFLRDLAKAAIDAGADVFAVSGIHHLGPVEIYKGRPIFYGLGNFFWSDMQESLPEELFQINRASLARAFVKPELATDADITGLLNAQSFANEVTFESVAAVNRFRGNRVSEVRLYPVDLFYGAPLTQSGIPRLATGKKARKIIARLQDSSRDFGSDVRIKLRDGIGLIRL
ncbi:MAG TPA: CapA family protein [Dongiaceae bacterium]|nr:CapA family protein [Dongiaceae bacterium]